MHQSGADKSMVKQTDCQTMGIRNYLNVVYCTKLLEYVTGMISFYLKCFYLVLQKYSKSDFVPLK